MEQLVFDPFIFFLILSLVKEEQDNITTVIEI